MHVKLLHTWQRNLLLALLGLAFFALFWPARLAIRQSDVNVFLGLALGQTLLCLLGVALIWNAKAARSTLLVVLAMSGLLRLGMLFETPRLSDDIYRYVWDGRVQSAGINPYRYVPVDPALASLRDEAIFPRINRRTYAPTIYPPMAQMTFWAIHQVTGSVVGFKACLLLFEAITIWCVMHLLGSFGLPRARVLLYAWNPLVLWEFSGSGHIDAVMIAFIALALVARRAERNTLTGVLLGAAALTKFFPLALFPALYRRWDWKMPAALAAAFCLGYVPYLSAGPKVLGFLSTYADEEGIRSGRYFPFQLLRALFGGLAIPTNIYLALVVLLLGGLAWRALWSWNNREDGFLLSAAVLSFAFTFCLSPQFPWYWSWTVPFLVFLPWRAMLPLFLLTASSLLFYGKWFNDSRWFGFAVDRHFALSLVHLVPVAALAFLLFYAKRRGVALQNFGRVGISGSAAHSSDTPGK